MPCPGGPGEPRERLRRGKSGRLRAVPDEENGCFGSGRDRPANSSQSLGAPAIREADDDQAGACGGLNDAVVAGWDQDRLGNDADDLLQEQRGACEEPARIAAPECRVCFGAEQAEVGFERCGEPAGELDR